MKNQNPVPFSKIRLLFLLVLVAVFFLFVTVTAFMKNPGGSNQAQDQDPSAELWTEISGTTSLVQTDQKTVLQPDKSRSFTLNRSGMESLLASVPGESDARR